MSRITEPLNCETFEDRIHQVLDDRLTLTGDSLLMEHAGQCSPCESKLHDYDAVEDSVKILKEDMKALLAGANTPPRKRPLIQRPIAMLASLAAGLLVCFYAYHQIQPEEANASHPVAKNIEKTTSVAKRPPKTPTVKPNPIRNSGLAATGIMPRTRHYRPTPDTSPFSPNFKVSNSIPRIPSATQWTSVTNSIGSLEPVLNYPVGLPGVRETKCSIAVTIELIRQSLTKPAATTEPDLGWNYDIDLTATA